MNVAESDKNYREWRGFTSQLQVQNGDHACVSISIVLAIHFHSPDLRLNLNNKARDFDRIKTVVNTCIRAGAALDWLFRSLLCVRSEDNIVIGVEHVRKLFDCVFELILVITNR